MSPAQLTTTTFDEVGNVRTRTDAANKTTTYTYDNVNRQKTITTPTNDTTTFNYDLAGNQTEVINARGKITTSVYDSMNRVEQTITPDNESTYTDYLLSGAIEKITNARNEITTIVSDALFQTIGYINALGQQSNQILDALGRTVVNIDADGNLGTNWYDELGRSIGFLDGLGNSTREDYDAAGNRIRSVDANGNETQYQYTNLGQLWVTIDPNGGRVTQTYDANGNLRTYTDPLGNTTTFTYDSQGREIQRTDALGNSLTYTYDSRNLMLSQTDRLGRRKDWTYDDNGRVETETWFTSGIPVNTLTYTYDANGNLLTAADDDGTYTLTYDNQDRLWTQTGLFGVSLTFTYDELSRRNRIEDSFNGVMSSVYDAAGRLEKRQFGGAGQATLTYERDYSANGELLAARRYSDLSSTNLIGSTTYGYDAAYRLTYLQHKDGTGANIAAYTMTFDNGGRITEEIRNSTSTTYSYDNRSQLTQAGADAYSYDDNGNRTMAGYTTGGMNQLTNDGTFTYTYDLEGNVSTKSKGPGLEKWYYSYDHNNRLLSVRKTSDGTTDTLTVTYAYDVFGNRVKEDKWSSGPGLVTTKFVYVGQEVYLDLDNSNNVLMRYIQGDTADEMIVRIDGNNIVAWFLADRLGSIRDIVDDTGTLADSIIYDAYGKITAETNSANRGNYGAFGYVFDSDTGFAIMPAGRPYSVETGRFGGTDKLWEKGGLPNFYGYTGNNPTNATDPSGLEWKVICQNTYSRCNDDIGEKDAAGRDDYEVARIRLTLEQETGENSVALRLKYVIIVPKHIVETGRLGMNYYLRERTNGLKPANGIHLPIKLAYDRETRQLESVLSLGSIPLANGSYEGTVQIHAPDMEGKFPDKDKDISGGLQLIQWYAVSEEKALSGYFVFSERGFSQVDENKRPGNTILRLIESSTVPKRLWKDPFPEKMVKQL